MYKDILVEAHSNEFPNTAQVSDLGRQENYTESVKIGLPNVIG
jgi:hypothetical protein